MIKVQNYLFNPVLTPQPQHSWESKAAFNGSLTQFGNQFLLAYRALDDHDLSTIGLAYSHDLHTFSHRRQIIKPEYIWEQYGCEDPRLCHLDGSYYVFYTAIGGYPPSAQFIKVALARTTDFQSFEKHLITPFNAKAMALFPQKIGGQITAVLTVNTDSPPAKICLASFDNIDDLWSPDYWQQWSKDLDSHQINLPRLTTDHVEVGAAPVLTDDGWLLIYSHIQNYFVGKEATFGIEAVLLDHHHPDQIIGRTTKPLLIPQEDYELQGVVPNVIFPSGATIHRDDLFIYYGAADTTVALAKTNLSHLLADLKSNRYSSPKLTRYFANPIITPKPNLPWQSKAVFNPAAVLIDHQVHLVYRAMGSDNTSVLAYAKSTGGFTITHQSDTPIYVPSYDFEIKKAPLSFSGCEDPRMTIIDDYLYLCYTAYDGQTPPKIALTSISVDDFANQRWNFAPPKIISDPTTDNKDGCLFPEKIKNQYVFFHRHGGRGILIDYVDDLNFSNSHLTGEACFLLGDNSWENEKMGIASPPLKTEFGWLLLYHAVSSFDHHYRLGAMLLDINDPHLIVGRSQFPILEPITDYEKFGQVNNVVFPCGAVIKDNILFVYYGGADTVIATASIDLPTIIHSLK